jgi:hypothetical protein
LRPESSTHYSRERDGEKEAEEERAEEGEKGEIAPPLSHPRNDIARPLLLFLLLTATGSLSPDVEELLDEKLYELYRREERPRTPRVREADHCCYAFPTLHIACPLPEALETTGSRNPLALVTGPD